MPTLEAMKVAAPKAGPLAAEGAVRLFNVFQDLGQVVGPIAGGAVISIFGFEHAAQALGAVSCVYAAAMLLYLGMAGGGIEYKRSTVTQHSPPLLRSLELHTEGESRSDARRVLVLNDPLARSDRCPVPSPPPTSPSPTTTPRNLKS